MRYDSNQVIQLAIDNSRLLSRLGNKIKEIVGNVFEEIALEMPPDYRLFTYKKSKSKPAIVAAYLLGDKLEDYVKSNSNTRKQITHEIITQLASKYGVDYSPMNLNIRVKKHNRINKLEQEAEYLLVAIEKLTDFTKNNQLSSSDNEAFQSVLSYLNKRYYKISKKISSV